MYNVVKCWLTSVCWLLPSFSSGRYRTLRWEIRNLCTVMTVGCWWLYAANDGGTSTVIGGIMPTVIKNSPRLLDETLVPLKETGAKHFPVPCSYQTVRRCVQWGWNGITLESVTVGSRRFTSKEAIARFLSAQAGAQPSEHPPRINSPQVGGRMSAEEIAEKSRAFNLPD